MTQLPTTRTVRRARKAQRRGAMQRRVTIGATMILIGLMGVVAVGFAGGPGAHGNAVNTIAFAIALVLAAAGLAMLGWGLTSSDPVDRPVRDDEPAAAAAPPRR
jgi:hypothetical protein